MGGGYKWCLNPREICRQRRDAWKIREEGQIKKEISVLFCCCRRLGVLTTDLIFVRKPMCCSVREGNTISMVQPPLVNGTAGEISPLSPEEHLRHRASESFSSLCQATVSKPPLLQWQFCLQNRGQREKGRKRTRRMGGKHVYWVLLPPFCCWFFFPLCLFHFTPWHRYPSLHLSFQSLSPHPLHLPSPFSALSSSPPLIHTAISPWFLERGGTAAAGIQTSWLNTHIHTHIGRVHYGMCIDRWEEMRGKFGKSGNMFGQKQEKGEVTKSFTGECKSGLGRVVENWQQRDTCQQILSTSFIIYAMDMRYEVSFGLSQHFKM